MKKIIHLSDLHIGYNDLGDRFDCIASNIIFGKQPADQYVIVITGDIVESAFARSGFDEAEAHIERLRVLLRIGDCHGAEAALREAFGAVRDTSVLTDVKNRLATSCRP